MKGKRPTTEDKSRILRAADGGKNIVEVGKEKNLSEQTFPRWKRQFGLLEVNEATRRDCRRRPRTGAMCGPGTSSRTRPCVAAPGGC